MGAIPYAFSVHHFISTVGADAGFAAIIGLAILILLYFSQARETASLREWAAESAQHVQELEARLAQLTRAQGSSPSSSTAPAPPPAGVVRTGSTPRAAAAAARAGVGAPTGSRTVAPVSAQGPVTVPAAPAGVGAPALSAATRLIPSSDRQPISIRAGSSIGVASPEHVPVDGDTIMAPPGPAPATAAGGANGSSAPRVPAPAGAGALASRSPGQAPPRRGEMPVGARPGAPRAATNGPRRPGTPPSRTGSPSGGRSRIGRGVIVVLGLLAVAAVVVVLLVVTSSSGSNKTPASGALPATGTKTHERGTGGAGTVTPSSVTVAVLNGTATTNLAHTIAGRLTAAGFKEGNVATATDQTHTATVVGFFPHHRAAALTVAQSLKLGSASVQPVDQSSQTVACPASSTPCGAQVVVTVGSDLASNT